MGQPKRSGGWLWVILGAYVVLGIVYDVTSPIFEKPDEALHFLVVKYVKENHRLPVYTEGAAYGQEALQAPLYYLIVAALVSPVDLSDAEARLWPNPKANYGDAGLPEKKNVWIHTSAETFPWRNTTLAVHVGRWVSLAFGLGTILCAHRLARLVASHDERLALTTAALIAFLPQFLYIHSSLSNDSAITFFSTLSLTALVWTAEKGLTLRRASWLGVSLGLMALSKLSGSALALVSLSALVWVAWRRREWTRLPAFLALAGSWALLIAGWWYLRNVLLYGNPLATTSFIDRFPNPLTEEFTGSIFLGQARVLLFSTWGYFGQLSILMQPLWIYAALTVMTGLAALAWAFRFPFLSAAPKLHGFDVRHPELVAAWALVVFAMVAYWWWVGTGNQGRLLFPALPSLALLGSVGLIELSGFLGWRRPLLESAPTALLAALAVVSPLAYIAPAYSPPRVVTRLPDEARNVRVDFGDQIRLEAYRVRSDGDRLVMVLYWRALRPISADYQAVIRMQAPDGGYWLDYVNYPGMGTSLTSTWREGELRADTYEFRLSRLSPPTAPMALLVGFYDPETRSVLEPVTGVALHHEGYLAVLDGGIIAAP